MKKKSTIAKGNLLVAEPFMLDPYFKQSVVLLCDHHSEGAFGFILNKSVRMNINELLDDFPEFESEVYYGGPVATDTIHYIHNVGELLDESQKVDEGIFWGGNFDKLKFLITHEMLKPENIRFFVGYAGWEADQLKEEMQSGSWIQSESDRSYVFNHSSRDLWKNVLANKNENYSIIANNPNLNALN